MTGQRANLWSSDPKRTIMAARLEISVTMLCQMGGYRLTGVLGQMDQEIYGESIAHGKGAHTGAARVVRLREYRGWS